MKIEINFWVFPQIDLTFSSLYKKATNYLLFTTADGAKDEKLGS